MFENPRRNRQARNFTENDPKILDLKSSSEQIMFRKLSLGAPDRLRDQNPPRPRVSDFGPAAKKHTKSSISIKLYSRYHFI